jgi:tripartite-type tricarboxylate transporter receptor subunit TctC
VDNRPGGDTIIGAEALVKSPRDGYTIMLIAGNHVTIPLLHQNVPFDAIKDFDAVATLTVAEQLLALHPSVPANNLKELIALAKAKPGQLTFAGSGNGGPSHLAGELFGILARVKIQHVPYKGSGPAVIDLIGGHVQMYFGPGSVLISHIQSGRLKAVAISGDKRLSSLPQVRTFTEQGLPGFDVRIWYGVLAPGGTPADIVNKLSSEIGRILAMPDITEKLAGLGFDPFISTPEQFAALMRADMARSANIIKTANIKLE